MRSVVLYVDLLKMQLVARGQYRADFLTGVAASILQHMATLGTLWLIFAQVPALGGWNVAQAVVLYGVFSLTLGLTNFLASGLRDLPTMVRQGELDGFLVQPASAYVQLLPRLNLNAISDVVVSLTVLLGAAQSAGVRWTLPVAAYALLAVVCGTAIFLGFLTAVYSISFWSPYPGLMAGVEGLTQLARFPAGIYPRWLQAIITWVFPVAFAGHYPAAVLTGAEAVPWWMALAGLGLAAAALGAGAFMWRWGLSRYEGSGN